MPIIMARWLLRRRLCRRIFLLVTICSCVGLVVFRGLVLRVEEDITSINVPINRVKRMLRQHHAMLFKDMGRVRHIFTAHAHKVYSERRKRIENACASIDHRTDALFMERFVNASWFVEDIHLLYCTIPKTGCTFWKRVLEVLRRHQPGLRSPYKLLYEECVPGRTEAREHIEREVSRGNSISSVLSTKYTKFMFSRDPWKRLFSVYIDKMFSPNAPMWKMAGRDIIPKDRQVPTVNNTRPGHNASFAEFIDYVLTEKSMYLDPHMQPTSRVCDVCKIHFDIIGKMETFQGDFYHIMSSINATHRLVFKNLRVESDVDRIVEVIGRAYQYRSDLEEFLPFHRILRRLWERFKIDNVLDKDETFPWTEEESCRIEMEDVANIVVDLYRRSSRSPRHNKKVAFIQAFRQLTNDRLEALRKMFRFDFELFDYDASGPHLQELESVLPASDLEHDYYNILR